MPRIARVEPQQTGPECPLTRALAGNLGSSSDQGALAEAWRRAWAAATEAWPTVHIPEDAVAAWVAERMPREREPVEELARLHVADLYLACGCIRGHRDALQAFERAFGSDLVAAARSGGATVPDEVVQHLRVRLLVGPETRLRAYAGTGPLGRWLRIACRRLAIDARRSEQHCEAKHIESGALMDLLGEDDAELGALKSRYRAAFRQAFAEAMAALTPRTRNLLRLHLIHQLTIDEIAPMYQVHRATAARWLGSARREILERTRECLSRLLGADSRDAQSVLDLIASRLDVSLARHLEVDDEADS